MAIQLPVFGVILASMLMNLYLQQTSQLATQL